MNGSDVYWARVMFLVALLAWWVASPVVAAPASPERLVYLIDYVATDYPMAVRDGEIANNVEYGEILRFTREVVHEYKERPNPSTAILKDLGELEALLVRRAPHEEVWTVARRLVPALTRALGAAPPRPSELPNLANGRSIYGNHCRSCHGPTGGGDGPDSGGQQPPPTAFRGDYLRRLSPRQIYSAVSMGVDATAMASFASKLTEQQRWDVAFFVPTLRVGFSPKRPHQLPRLTIEELANTSNLELLEKLQKKDPEVSELEADWLRVNFVSPDGQVSPFAGPSVLSGSGVAAALDVQDAFVGVAERLAPNVVGVTGFVKDPNWSSEKLMTERGEAWMARNFESVRHPGFRPVRAGSGLLLDGGYVLTSSQLIRDQHEKLAGLIEVEIAERKVMANVVGSEPAIDLAILRLPESDAAAQQNGVDFGDSDRLQTGHWVIALGDPPGAEQSMSVGVVASSPKRQCYQSDRSATLLQTSLVIPAGGLGGPVVDILGNVVGLSVSPGKPTDELVAPSGGPRVLPVNLVLNLFEALKISQSNRSPWIGISVLELPLAQKQYGAKIGVDKFPPSGVYIDDVFTPGPAPAAGVLPGDFLVGLGGHSIQSVADFQKWLYVSGIGAQAKLDLVRDGKPFSVIVTIEARPPSATTY